MEKIYMVCPYRKQKKKGEKAKESTTGKHYKKQETDHPGKCADIIQPVEFHHCRKEQEENAQEQIRVEDVVIDPKIIETVWGAGYRMNRQNRQSAEKAGWNTVNKRIEL